MEQIEQIQPRATPSMIPGRRERLEARLRQAEVFLRDSLQKLGSPEGCGGEDTANGVGVLDPSANALAASPERATGWDARAPVSGLPSILIVDLYEASRVALGALLRTSGYPVVEAGSSRDLPSSGEFAPLLIVFDPGPHLDAALRTVARMRIEQTAPPVPVVLLSAAMTAEQRDRALAIGCSEVLPKPCVEAELLAAVGRLVGPPPRDARPEILSPLVLAR